MQVVILCGGKGTRMLPTTERIPKPLIFIGNKPILWHIMKIYARHGHKDFILLLGYMGEMIREFFNKPENKEPGWNITFLETGVDTKKGQRILMAKDLIKGDNFLLAYGDDLCNVDINEVVRFHESNGDIVTITAVRPVSSFGVIEINDNNEVVKFKEKPVLSHWISGGYLVLNRKIFDHIKPGMDETDAFEELAKSRAGSVRAFKHDGFWMTMNTIQDMNSLNDMWEKGELQKKLYPENSRRD
jgi:glucose-1-phosphate cytidylyltransferase